jgi:hypothetical protein
MKDLIRLSGAVTAALVVTIWGVVYNGAMIALIRGCDFSEDRLSALPDLTLFCYDSRWFWMAVPLMAAAIGGWALRRGKPVLLQLDITLTWLLCISWVLLIHLAWILPLLPLCSPVSD